MPNVAIKLIVGALAASDALKTAPAVNAVDALKAQVTSSKVFSDKVVASCLHKGNDCQEIAKQRLFCELLKRTGKDAMSADAGCTKKEEKPKKKAKEGDAKKDKAKEEEKPKGPCATKKAAQKKITEVASDKELLKDPKEADKKLMAAHNEWHKANDDCDEKKAEAAKKKAAEAMKKNDLGNAAEYQGSAKDFKGDEGSVKKTGKAVDKQEDEVNKAGEGKKGKGKKGKKDEKAKKKSLIQVAQVEGRKAPEDELAKEMTHDLEMNFNKIAPFGKEDTAKELQDHAAKTQDTLVDAVENAEVAEIKRAVFRALTRLRAATIKEFDTIARLETQAIDAYNDAHHYRAENPLAHLHEDEAPVETDKLKSFH